ncbi:MAG: DEAD/DEAH box helicase [Candidatus Aenigmatarchaeota archaeon]
MEKFRKLGLEEPILEKIRVVGFEKPSEIQEKTIPLVLEGKDIIAASYTGSGKTLVFGLPMIQSFEKGAGIQGLVLTPTRELAIQVTKELKKFSQHSGLKVVSVYGGVSIEPQIGDLETADIVVGTPGRLLDHIERETIVLKGLKTLVLDEADMMLDMGFLDDVRDIIDSCPKKRQTLLFSATMPEDVAYLAEKYMRHPEKISAEAYYDVHPDGLKFSLLVHLLKNESRGIIMVFCNTRHNVDFVSHNLKAQGIDTLAIHGGFTQSKRDSIMKSFHSKTVTVLVCTDVAARGLDIPDVTHVYNYDIPKDSKEYIHRAGRTARAGKEGKVVNVVSSRDVDNFRNVLVDYDMKISEMKMPRVERVRIIRLDRDGKLIEGFGGERRSFGGERRSFGGERRDFGGERRGFSGERRDSGGRRESFGDRGPRGYYKRRDEGSDKKPPEITRGRARPSVPAKPIPPKFRKRKA